MEDSKLILLLKTFDKEDWRWFRKFLLSPYFNSREELILLFDYLRKQAPDFGPLGLKKEKIFKKIFPKQPFNEKDLSYSMSYLLSLAEKFLMQRQFEDSPPNMNNHLLRSLVNRQLNKHYNFHFDKFEKQLQTYQTVHIDYYLQQYHLAEIAHTHFETQNLRQNDNQQLQETHRHLNQFYFLHLLKHSCELLTRKKAYGGEFQPLLTDSVIHFLQQQENIDPLLSIFLQIYTLLKEENPSSDFELLKTLLQQFEDKIPQSEKRFIFLHAINYCLLQINKNNQPNYYVEQSLELYLKGIKEGFLLNNGYLSPWTFKNVIRLGLNLKRYSFTEDFIQTYHKQLELEFQEDALHYNLANLYYQKKDYQTAQIHLIQVQFSDIFYTLGAKTMLLKIYYVQEEIEALFSLMASFSIYLRRNKKISSDYRATFSNFNSLLSQIVRAQKDKIPAIVEKINNTKQLTERKWLLEICNPSK